MELNYVPRGHPSINLTDINFISADLPIMHYYFIMSLSVTIIVLNFFVVTTSGLIVKKGLEPKSTYLLLGNLAVTDMLTGIITVLITAYFKDVRYNSRISCCFQVGSFVASIIVSVYTIVLIAIDRYLYIMYGIKYNQLVYPKRVRLMIGLTWLFGIVVGNLPSFGWSNDWHAGDFCRVGSFIPRNLIYFIAILATLPIPIILVTYIRILIKTFQTIRRIKTDTNIQTKRALGDRYRSESSMSESTSETSNNSESTKPEDIFAPRQNKANHKKWKAIKVVLFTTGGYIISWTPIFIDSLFLGFCNQTKTPERCFQIKNFTGYLSLLTFLNCFLNPIIYAWWHKGFQKAAKKIYSKKSDQFIAWFQNMTSK